MWGNSDMKDCLYIIYDKYGEIGRFKQFHDAMLFMKALFEEYWEENLDISIKRVDKIVDKEN